MALIIVLWIMAVLTLLMYAFLTDMQVEYALAGYFGEEKKAEQLAWSGIDLACARLAEDVKPWHQLTDPWSNDAQQYFEAGLGEGAYTLLHPVYAEDGRAVYWGAEDEASKINLNTAPKEVLMRLPRVTEEIADSIIDWRDADSTPGAAGAESSYYQGLVPPYTCKNQPFETIEELLYVRGMTPEILFGEDANLNGRLDPAEDDASENLPHDNRDGRLDPGLYAFVTAVSQERNVTLEGEPRLNLNTAPPQALAEVGVPQAAMAQILQRRLTGPPFRSVMEILPFMEREQFRRVVDFLTVADGETLRGLVNVNTAPLGVLLALPGMSQDTARRIIEYRARTDADLSSIGWLAEIAPPQELEGFANLVTVRSYQFRIHAVGRVGTPYNTTTRGADGTERPGAYKRMLAIFDKLARPRPRLVYWKDMTKLGMPYDPEDGPNP